jgi:glycosyltransferase involved in cell wall biosynthesis
VLSVGRIEPRKNLVRLIRAFATVRMRLSRDLSLAIAGRNDFRSRAVIEEAERGGAAVKLLGAVPDRDLPGLYRLSEALLYPSLAEGFGIPVLEAMACGTPVLASPRGALPEVGGDAVLWVDPEDQVAIEAGIERILTDSELRKRLSAAGPARASLFDWNETARRTLAAYHRATGSFDSPRPGC